MQGGCRNPGEADGALDQGSGRRCGEKGLDSGYVWKM